jgi:tetratricopeptide (TPR) repeat protein
MVRPMCFLRFTSALILAGLLASCGNPKAPGDAAKKPTAEEQAAALAGVDATKEGEKKAGEGNLSQELLDKLAATQSDDEAAQLEEEVWDAWLVSGSGTIDVLMRRGLEAQENEDLETARDMFDRVIMIRPQYAEGWNRRALLFFNDKQYDEAVADLESALTYEPRHFGAWIGLGMIFESIDRPEAALLAYRKALAIHPHAAAAVQGEKRLKRAVEGMPL